MKPFRLLNKIIQKRIIDFQTNLVNGKYNDFDRVVSEEDYKINKIKLKKELSKLLKQIKN